MNSGSGDFHRPIPVHDLPAAGRAFGIEARAEERGRLAARFGLLALDALRCDGVVRPEAAGRRVRLKGRLRARVVQQCVVTLEPFATDVDSDFERLFGFDVREEWPEDAGSGGEVWLDLSDELPAEPLRGDSLDVGEVVAEELSLDLEAYPRSPGAEFGPVSVGPQSAATEPSEANPFADLARRRRTPWVP